MGHDNASSASTSDPTASAALRGRSELYAVLARGLSQPDESVAEFFASRAPGGGEGQIAGCLDDVIRAAQDAPLEELARAYMKLLDPLNGPFPYEVAHLKAGDFTRVHVMADINGFYRAFGVEPNKDRPDHVAAELEFMHLLTFKQAHALGAGQIENASLCEQAGEKFFREHLSTWVDPLIDSLRARDPDALHPFYARLIDLLELFMESEKESLA